MLLNVPVALTARCETFIKINAPDARTFEEVGAVKFLEANYLHYS